MRLTLLGTGTALADAERGATAFLIERDGARVLVDGGPGTLRALGRAGVSASQLSGGVLSHRHIDHCGELPGLLFAMRVADRAGDYPLWGAEGLAEHVEALRRAYPRHWLEGRSWTSPVHELPADGPGEARLPGGVRLRTAPAVHGAGALHLRFDADSGSSWAFSGDTGPSAALAELAQGVDLLVVECAFPGPRDDAQHLWPEAVAELVDRARPQRVLLTHLYPETDPSRALAVVAAAGRPVERAVDGQVLDL